MIGGKSRILLVMGTRPEAIKLAPLVKTLQSMPEFEVLVCATAQHRSMLDQVLNVFGIVPDYDLDLMRPGQDLSVLTAGAVTTLTGVVRETRPDWVVVQGDTASAFAGGLAAYYERCAIAHVEAGLRTDDIYSPFPEEMNRRLISALASLHFVPTERARDNLLAENTPAGSVHLTGNTVVDSLLWVVDRLHQDAALRHRLEAHFSFLGAGQRLILVTGHRRESFGAPYRNVCHALVDILNDAPDVEILYPVHLNPNVRAPVKEILGALPEHLARRMHIIEPVDYLYFTYLMQRADVIITDSGGVQEEAPTFGTPVLVIRETTERPEGIAAGVARLVGTGRERIVRETLAALERKPKAAGQRAVNPYGDGLACTRIALRLLEASGHAKARFDDLAVPATGGNQTLPVSVA